jgi:hypothetical protein
LINIIFLYLFAVLLHGMIEKRRSTLADNFASIHSHLPSLHLGQRQNRKWKHEKIIMRYHQIKYRHIIHQQKREPILNDARASERAGVWGETVHESKQRLKKSVMRVNGNSGEK